MANTDGFNTPAVFRLEGYKEILSLSRRVLSTAPAGQVVGRTHQFLGMLHLWSHGQYFDLFGTDMSCG